MKSKTRRDGAQDAEEERKSEEQEKWGELNTGYDCARIQLHKKERNASIEKGEMS